MQIMMLLIFVTCFLIIYLVSSQVFVKKEAIERIKTYTNIDENEVRSIKPGKANSKSNFGLISKKIGNVKVLEGYKKKIQKKLNRAHIFLKAEEFITVMVAAYSIIAFIALIITNNFLSGLLFGIIGFVLPNFILNIKIKKRIKTLNNQLGDAITLISNSLKAGFSFLQAVDAVAEEMDGPISEEFKAMKNEVSFGTKTEKALENMTLRVKSDDLDLVVTAVLIQRQIGGNLSEVLDNISNTIRERIKIKGDVKALTAQGKMSGIVISVLPPGLCLILYLINRSFMGVLFTEPIGWAILGLALVMELIGIFVISRVIKIEV